VIVVVWLAIALVLFLFELHHLAFYALFGAVGCLAGALVALIGPGAVALQIAVAVVVAGVGVVVARPQVSKAFASRHEGHVARGVHGGLVGQEAVTLDAVGDDPEPGHVRLVGERWLAVSGSGETIPARTTVLVTAVAGTTLTVWPIGVLGGSSAVDAGSSD
jgi:membrane protein implicated in regulation of membrane protease activity